MAKHYLEQVVGRSIAGAQTGIMGLRSTVAGKLEKVTIYTKGNVASTQTFDVNHGTHAGDLATVFPTQADRPSITLGNHSDEATPTGAVTVAVGDLFTVDADVVNESFELATIVFQIEDGLESGVGILARPGTSIAEDEEFEGAALDAKWTKTNSAAVESYNDKIKSAYYFYHSVGSSDVSLKQNYANAGDFSVTLCGSVFMQEDFNNLSLSIADSAENNYIQIQALYNSGVKVRNNKNVAGVYTPDVNSVAITREYYPTIWLHIQRSGNNWSLYYSNNGVDFTQLGTAIGLTFTVHHFTIGFGIGGGATKKCPVVLHWIRRDWLTL